MIKYSFLILAILCAGCSKPVLRSKMESNVPHTFYEPPVKEKSLTSDTVSLNSTVQLVEELPEQALTPEQEQASADEAERIMTVTACDVAPSKLEAFQTRAEVSRFLKEFKPTDHEIECKAFNRRPAICAVETYSCLNSELVLTYAKTSATDELYMLKEFKINPIVIPSTETEVAIEK